MNLIKTIEISLNHYFHELDLIKFVFPFIFLSLLLYLIFRKMNYFSKRVSILISLILGFLATPLFLSLKLNLWLVIVILLVFVLISYFKYSKNKVVFLIGICLIIIACYLIIMTGFIRNMFFLATDTFAYMVITVLCLLLVKRYVLIE